MGVDTPGCEQVFHIANRWQSVLSNTPLVHQELFLLMFAREHNKAHSCEHAVAAYRTASRQGNANHRETEHMAPASADDSICSSCLPQLRKNKRPKRTQPPEACGSVATTEPRAADVPQEAHLPVSTTLYNEFAVVNERTKPMHSVIASASVYSDCAWSFQGRARPERKDAFKGKGFWHCGVCYGHRHLFA